MTYKHNPKTFILMSKVRQLSYLQARIENEAIEEDLEQEFSEYIHKLDIEIRNEIARLYGESYD